MRFDLVALRLYDDVTEFLFLPQSVHTVQHATSSLHVLLVVAAATARVVEAGAAVGPGAALHLRAGRPTTRTAVHARADIQTVERTDIGAVQLTDDLLACRRSGHTPAAAAHGCGTANGHPPRLTRCATIGATELLGYAARSSPRSASQVYRHIRLRHTVVFAAVM